jgi:hypothetical protein
MTVLLRQMMYGYLRRSRPRTILTVFQCIHLPVFRGLRPCSSPHLLRLATKAMSDRLLAPSSQTGVIENAGTRGRRHSEGFVCPMRRNMISERTSM